MDRVRIQTQVTALPSPSAPKLPAPPPPPLRSILKKEHYLPRLFAWISLRQLKLKQDLAGIFLFHTADKLKEEHEKAEHGLVLAWGQESPCLVHCRQDLTEVAGNMETEKYIQKPVILKVPNYSLVEGQQPPMTTSTLQNHIHKIIQKGVNQTNCPFSVDRWAEKKAVVRE